MEFHHIGIACENIEETLKFIEAVNKIHYLSEIVYDEKQDVYLCMVTIENNLKLELISGGKVEGFVKKKIILYHICYEVDDIKGAIDSLLKNGATIISEPREAILFDNKKVAFLITPLGIVELLEKRN